MLSGAGEERAARTPCLSFPTETFAPGLSQARTEGKVPPCAVTDCHCCDPLGTCHQPQPQAPVPWLSPHCHLTATSPYVRVAQQGPHCMLRVPITCPILHPHPVPTSQSHIPIPCLCPHRMPMSPSHTHVPITCPCPHCTPMSPAHLCVPIAHTPLSPSPACIPTARPHPHHVPVSLLHV